LTVLRLRREAGLSVRRLARSFELPVSRIGRWIGPARRGSSGSRRRCPVSGDTELRRTIQELCLEERYQGYGYRRIWALLRRKGWSINRKTVWRIMREAGLSRPKIRHRRYRPKRVEKMQPASGDQAWQIDMTSFQLADLTPLFLVVVTDCFTREIVGWTLDRRCRAAEWVSAVRQALEYRGWRQKGDLDGLVLRSDNGAQPCSKRFAEYLGTVGIRGQYTGYNAPDDNAYVERVIRTIKEEEIWLNQYESWAEAHRAIEQYMRFYNEQRIHSALDYRTPKEFAQERTSLKAT
jgi:putative transposase